MFGSWSVFAPAGASIAYTLITLLVTVQVGTGVGLGVDTANRVALQYEINPDPERVFYAHNTFVQAYLEQGPLGALGMLLVPLVLIATALIARRLGVVESRRALLIAGLLIASGLATACARERGEAPSIGAVASAPSPIARAIGIMPAIMAALVMSTGRMRDRAA